MNENDVMVNEEVMNEVPEIVKETSGMGTGTAVLIGGVIAAGLIFGGKALLSMWGKHKTKKESEKAKGSNTIDFVSEAQEVEDSDEDK